MRNLGLGLAIGAALMGLLWLAFGQGPTVSERGASTPAGPPAGPAEAIRAGRTEASPVDRPGQVGVGPAATVPPAPASATPALPGAPPTASASLSPQQLVDAARRTPVGVPNAPSVVAQRPGRLSVDAVRAGIDAARPEVKRCYEEALAQNAGLAGKLMVKFVVVQAGGKGRIREADLDEEASDAIMLNPFLGMCVLKAMGEIEYPAPEGDGEVVVRFPFQFDATPDEEAK